MKQNYFDVYLKEKEYLPHLLFEDTNILSNIEKHQAAIWRCSEHK